MNTLVAKPGGTDMRNNPAFFACLGLLFLCGCGSDPAPSTRMGPFSAWSDAVNLGAAINTTFVENEPSISTDGLSLYFYSNRPGGFGQFDMYVSQRAKVADPWGQPRNLGPLLNGAGTFNGVPTLTADDHWLFFCSSRPGGFGAQDIWMSHRSNIHDDFGWEAPVNAGAGVNGAQRDCDPTPFVDPQTGLITLYFASLNRPGGTGDWDLYMSMQAPDGTFGPAVLIPELDTLFRETRCAIRRDGLEIIFTSDRPVSGGPLRLWSATRASTQDPWSQPVVLDSPINVPSSDNRGSFMSADGTILYFVSTRSGGFGGADIYLSTRTRQ